MERMEAKNMDSVYVAALRNMASTLRTLEGRVQPPAIVTIRGGQAYRYVEKTPHQAIIMKLARLATSLNAARVLLGAGLLQDQGAAQRVIDEMNEDVSYLSLGLIRSEWPSWNDRFLAEFWQEEFDAPTAMRSTQRRDRVPREKVRAFIAKFEEGGLDQSTRVNVTATVANTYSGYVHGAGSHIMEMYFGDPPRFHVGASYASPFWDDHVGDLNNYYLRGICSFGLAAAAFGDADLRGTIIDFRTHFEAAAGMSFDMDEIAKKMKKQKGK
ncbi:MAG: hypothetical protein Q8R63_06490 [Ramlibacter sp.]|nr:hypothetical protein [Ramlibacter sp.]